MSQAPQHFRSSEKQATCKGCFARQSICLVISLHSGMSKAVHPHEFSVLNKLNQTFCWPTCRLLSGFALSVSLQARMMCSGRTCANTRRWGSLAATCGPSPTVTCTRSTGTTCSRSSTLTQSLLRTSSRTSRSRLTLGM